MIETLETKTIFKNKYIELQNNLVKNKKTNNTYTHIKLIENNSTHPGSVILCKFNDKFLFLKNYRYGIDDYCWELPRGYKEEKESLEKCAIRELNEEININIDEKTNIIKLGEIAINSSILASKIALFFIEISSVNELIMQEEENIEDYKWIPIEEVIQKIKNKEIYDGFSTNAIMFYILNYMKII